MPRSVFTVHSIEEFENYIRLAMFRRPVTFIQNHHTFSPNYTDFANKPDHNFWLESMRNFHVNTRGWNDIGQNITTFPDGKVAVCRAIDITPAGIFGANKGAICIENLGDFDIGKNQMTEAHRNTILRVNAILCFKFSLRPVYAQVVYHHWFDTEGNRFPPAIVNSGQVTRDKLQKTCPGTAFFGGNTIVDATNNFYPQVNQLLDGVSRTNNVSITFTNKKVTATVLNVRGGHGPDFPVKRTLLNNSIVQVFSEFGDWSKISAAADEWVSSKFLTGI